MAADVGTGTTIGFGTTGFTAEIMNVDGAAMTREVIDTSHMGSTTWRTFIPGDLSDPGEVTFEFNFDPDEQPPINAPAETITITFPVPQGMAAGATLVGTGFISSWEFSDPFEDKMTGTATIKWSGALTWNDAT